MDASSSAADRERRFTEVLAAYLERVESGEEADREALIRSHPDLADDLVNFFVEQEQFAAWAAPVRQVIQAVESRASCADDPVVIAVEKSDAPPASQLPPFGNYEVLGVIAQGGMGVVYRAHQRGTNRPVAIKMIRAALLASAAEVERFRNEAEAAASLDHPHIVPVYEVGQHDGRLFFSMRLLGGGSLAQQLDRYRNDPKAVARLLVTVARAVHHAHQHGILHRDIKPSNILLDGEGRPHVTDFGLARRVETDSGLTQSGAILGTPSYMAPEQAEGRKGAVTTATDVYGLGAVLYALLTGRPPFQGETVLETLEQVKRREPAALSSIRGRLGRDLETICLKCLDKDPRRRYASAVDLAEDLERWLGGEPIRARSIGRAARLWRWSRRRPALALSAGMALGAVVAVAVVSLAFALYQSRTAEELRRRQRQTTDALRESERHRGAADQNRREADRLSAGLMLDRGLSLCEQGEIGTGLLWLARSLDMASRADANDLEWAIRVNLAAWRCHLHPLKAVLEHDGPVLAVAFTPDGRTILTGSDDGTVRFWRADTGQRRGLTLRHRGGVRTLALSPDGHTLATASGEPKAVSQERGTREAYTSWNLRQRRPGTIRFWDAASGKALGPPLPSWGRILSLSFSPDGRVLAAAGMDQAVRLWQPKTGKLLGEPLRNQGEVWALAFSPDGRTLLTADMTTGMARLWDVATGQPLRGGPQPTDCVWAAAFSPDGRTFLTGCGDWTVRLWDAATGAVRGVPLRHQSQVAAAAFAPDGRTILTGSYDYTARLWQTATGRPLGQPLAHGHAVQSVAFSPDGRSLVTGSWEGVARLWETAEGEPEGPRFEHRSRVSAARFSLDGRMVLTGSADGARLWDAATGQAVGPVLRDQAGVFAAAFSPDGRAVVTVNAHHTARLWGAATGKPMGQALGHAGEVDNVAWSPDGRLLMTACYDGAQLCEASTGKPLGLAWRQKGLDSALAFSPDSRLVLTSSADDTARLWDAATGKPTGEPLQHAAAVCDVAFSPDGRTVWTASTDGMVQRWDRATGERLGRPFQRPGSIGAQSRLGPDGRTFLMSYGDGTARLGDVVSGRFLGAPLGHDGLPKVAAFSPDARTILTLASNRGGRTARLWQVPAPLGGRVDQITCWTELITGQELGRDGLVHVLSAAAWRQRRLRLQELGGPPAVRGPGRVVP